MVNQYDFEDLSGQTFGELELLYYSGNSKYMCRCSCGVEKEIRTSDIKNGRTKSCGHLKRSRELNLTGQKFGKLTVIERTKKNKDNRWLFLCECDCGNRKEIVGKDIKSGKAKSCGDKKHNIEAVKKSNTTHGDTKSRLYGIYLGMKKRCYSERHHAYEDYGGRGISICAEWLNNSGYENFKKWALNNGYKEGLSIERVDVNAGYNPANCTWISISKQSMNKRNTIHIEIDGVEKTLLEWCDEMGLKYTSVWKRINKYGYTPEKALSHNTHRISV